MTANIITKQPVQVYEDVPPSTNVVLTEMSRDERGIEGRYQPKGHGWCIAFIPYENISIVTFEE